MPIGKAGLFTSLLSGGIKKPQLRQPQEHNIGHAAYAGASIFLQAQATNASRG